MSDLASAEDISGRVALYDIDLEAAQHNEIIGNKFNNAEGTKSHWDYVACPTIGEALTGADFVVISILPGTFDEMESDVHHPEKYGIYQSVGDTAVTDVISYGQSVTLPGLTLLNGPGNDIVAVTNLMAAGAHLILFTTGRGTPLGSAVPTVKISTNSPLADKKSGWIDFNAGEILNGKDLTEELYEYVIEVCEGRLTKNALHGFREISIFKDGVTL